MINSTGAVTLARAYDPYGNMIQSIGTGSTSYGYTSEWSDSSDLLYLRSRFYAPSMGRFQTRDTWDGDVNRPLSLNRWGYVEGNPIRYTDPTGKDIDCGLGQSHTDPGCSDSETKNEPPVHMVLICGQDMWGECQGTYGGDYRGMQPLTPEKNWAKQKGFSYKYYATSNIVPENALAVARGIATQMNNHTSSTKYIIVGFSGGAPFSTAVALAVMDIRPQSDILAVVELDSLINSTTNTEPMLNQLMANVSYVALFHSKEYEDSYCKEENPQNPIEWWMGGNQRPSGSKQISLGSHQDLAINQALFDTFIKPVLEDAIIGIEIQNQ